MRQVIVGFSKSRKLIPIGSWTIRLYQNTEFSHCYIRLPMTNFPSDKILHASEGKVQNMSGTQFDKRHRIVKEFAIPVTEDIYRNVINELHEASGDDYSIMQNVGIILVDVARLLGIKMRNPWTRGWNCSEFVAVVLLQMIPKYFLDIDPNTITPKQIYDILEELNKNGVIIAY